jgi:O-acetyl-ADP-ribose deacetylase (regulator of RNase III)
MIELVHGDLLAAQTAALVNAVNTVGIMGKGIALQFRKTYPAMYAAYAAECRNGKLRVGQMHVFDRGDSMKHARWIINFPTKKHWREPSRLADIESGLIDLVATIDRLKIESVAIPPLGCGLGGLQWSEVAPRIEAAFAGLADLRVQLYAPVAIPSANIR